VVAMFYRNCRIKEVSALSVVFLLDSCRLYGASMPIYPSSQTRSSLSGKVNILVLLNCIYIYRKFNVNNRNQIMKDKLFEEYRTAGRKYRRRHEVCVFYFAALPVFKSPNSSMSYTSFNF
jgi:hypothetical protein